MNPALLALAIFAAAQPVAPPIEHGAGARPAGDKTLVADGPSPEVMAAADRLSKALQFKTISTHDPAQSPSAEFEKLHKHLDESYPLIRERLKREKVGQTLLYTWLGSEPALKPVLLLGHLDVVPVEPGTEGKWTQPPFSGAIADGYVWGRGAIDDKGRALAALEAVEALLKRGHQPKRTILLALGHDEEVGGAHGAQRVAALLAERKVALEAVYDEGGSIMQGVLGVKKPSARVMVAEKGYLSVELVASAEGGHSSMPPAKTSIGRLSRALARLEKKPFPAHLTALNRRGLQILSREMSFGRRLMFGHPRLFGWFIKRGLSKMPSGNALIRTTLAPTIVEGGIKDNVLPSRARAVINLRLLPGDTVDFALKRIVKVIDDESIAVSPIPGLANEASPESPLDSPAFQAIAQATAEALPDVLVVPGLLPGATDSRHFFGLTSSIYRYRPWRAVTPEELKRFHGTDERVSLEDLEEYVRFYTAFIPKLDRL